MSAHYRIAEESASAIFLSSFGVFCLFLFRFLLMQ